MHWRVSLVRCALLPLRGAPSSLTFYLSHVESLCDASSPVASCDQVMDTASSQYGTQYLPAMTEYLRDYSDLYIFVQTSNCKLCTYMYLC